VRPDHLDEARIQEMLHGEISDAEAARAREHAKHCRECARRLEEAEEEERLVSTLLGQLDTSPPHVEVGQVLAEASEPPPLAAGRGRRWNRWVAGIVLALGIGGVAYAIPGSPFRRWVDDLIPGGLVREQGARVSEPVPVTESMGGIAVTPGPSFVISFTRPNGGSVRISRVEGEEVIVRAPAGSASYETGYDRLVIDPRGTSTTFEVDLPRSAPHIEIRVEGATILVQEGDRTLPALPASGVLPLDAPAK